MGSWERDAGRAARCSCARRRRRWLLYRRRRSDSDGGSGCCGASRRERRRLPGGPAGNCADNCHASHRGASSPPPTGGDGDRGPRSLRRSTRRAPSTSVLYTSASPCSRPRLRDALRSGDPGPGPGKAPRPPSPTPSSGGRRSRAWSEASAGRCRPPAAPRREARTRFSTGSGALLPISGERGRDGAPSPRGDAERAPAGEGNRATTWCSCGGRLRAPAPAPRALRPMLGPICPSDAGPCDAASSRGK